ncbi:MAG: metallophosphoesterase [Candidatus Saccharimonadales bacterium]
MIKLHITKSRTVILALILAIAALVGTWVTLKHNQSVPTTDSRSKTVSTVSGMVFDIEADPHMDENSDAATYKQTLANIVSDKPSFLMDLGDIFMVDKQDDKSQANLTSRYATMKDYYDLLGTIPLHFAMGNHDGEVGWDSLNTRNYRKTYFPDQTADKNYYSFEQNGSLFLVLDPYTYTTTKPNADSWGWTLGKEQYDWLTNTLQSSSAKYKFVFIHQLVGGDNQGRGGVEMAPFYEWGGKNLDGTDGFATKRPGWAMPIHQLLKEHGVSAVFKGHDHLFVKQDLDGIVYQTLPQPSHAGDRITASYNYKEGILQGGSGYLRVTIGTTEAKVEYVKADGAKTVAYSYIIK